MPEPATKKLKDKIDKAALAKAQIKQKQFDWTVVPPEVYGAKRLPSHQDGTPRAPRKVLLWAGGWCPDSNDPIKWLHCEYFEERYAVHMQRLDGGFKKALAELTEGGTALAQLSEKLFVTLMEDLQDPDRARRIPFRDRAMLYREVTEMQAKLKGDAATRDRHTPTNVTNVLAVMGQQMEPTEFNQMANKLQSVHEDVADIIEGVVTVADSEDDE